MVTKIANLLTIKSIVTMILTVVFAILSVRGQVGETQFLTVFAVVIAFYFGTQVSKSTTTGTSNKQDTD